jgi:CRP-like cAMP-binding protein
LVYEEEGSVKFTPAGNRRYNRVLASLADGDFGLVQHHLRPTALRLRQCVEAANRPVHTIHFPYTGIISVVAQTGNRQHEAEVGLVGWEGMTGVPVVLGTEPPACNAFVQVEGDGVSLSADELRELMQASSSLHLSLLRYAQVFVLQACHTALANAKGSVEQRLARWLLMAHDRLPGDSLRSTHEFLSLMLGVRRAGVTIALQHLQSTGVISTTRGGIEITDRPGLERSAGGFYGAPERELERLLEVRRQAAE